MALVLIAAVFATGLYFGRTGGPRDFTVTTQYAIGAVEESELEDLGRRTARREEEADSSDESEAQGISQGANERININTAESEALQTLPGVGPAIAERIIAHRETNGPFRIIEDITDVSGIGPARFVEIRDFITVE